MSELSETASKNELCKSVQPLVAVPFHVTEAQKLLDRVAIYLDQNAQNRVHHAYLFGAKAHDNQFRLSGEPYIHHPLAVTSILADLQLDESILIAALLHDVLEDTSISKSILAATFGPKMAEMVDGLSKLKHVKARSRAEVQAENFRKIMLAMVGDLRIMIVKLADRIHNMRTLGAVRMDKRLRIAKETHDIYAPIAHRLGIHAFYVELERLSFMHLNPMRFQVLEKAQMVRLERTEPFWQEVQSELAASLKVYGINARITEHRQPVYQLYRHLRRNRASFEAWVDKRILIVQVENTDACYRTFGVAHTLFKPVPGHFKDYIAIPRLNGYQALHTMLVGPKGMNFHLYIRSNEMHERAELGVALQWRRFNPTPSKLDSGAKTGKPATDWMSSILDLQQSASDAVEFFEHVKGDLYPEEIYVFTPKGDILRLPKGSTAVDFAYTIHTRLGDNCVSAKVDHQLMPLSTPLKSGQTIDIITSEYGRPNPIWLNFIRTGRARGHIRQYLKNLTEESARGQGEQLLRGCLHSLGCSLGDIPEAQIAPILRELRCETMNQLMAQIGLGNQIAALVARKFLSLPAVTTENSTRGSPESMTISGAEGLALQMGRCCHPIADDPILGYLSSGKGIVVHTIWCPNLAEYRKHPDKWIEMKWNSSPEQLYDCPLRIESTNQRGVLAKIAKVIAELGSDIEHVNLTSRGEGTAVLEVQVSVHDRKHLAHLIRRLRILPDTIRIQRIRN